tara:strand:- start:725 stop:1435 length:711 start_codon:yes stop_codon:yes gene_type:complete
MAIPVINEVPKYSTIIPSTKAKVTFRPFLVKEQKILLMALESQNEEDMIEAIVDTLDACYYDINPRNLTTFDIEYLFTKLRAKSVGESTQIGVHCAHCEQLNEIAIVLDNIEMEEVKLPPSIVLNDKFTLKLKYPSYNTVRENSMHLTDHSVGNLIFHLAVSSLDKLLGEEESINLYEEPLEERIKFLDNLNSHQFKQIMSFVETIPQLSHDVDFKCESCGKENKQQLKGTESFFG